MDNFFASDIKRNDLRPCTLNMEFSIENSDKIDWYSE